MSEEDNEEYICLINEEEQYSIWFAWKEIPLGWERVGPKGTKQEILNYVPVLLTTKSGVTKEFMNIILANATTGIYF